MPYTSRRWLSRLHARLRVVPPHTLLVLMNRLSPVRPVSAACLAVLLGACTLSPPRSTPSRAGKPQPEALAASTRPGSARDVLTQAEIRAANAGDAYDLVQRLRPAWLRQNVNASPAEADGSREIRVWVNGRDAGGLATLRNYDSHQIVSMRWVDSLTALATYGPGYGRGVITLDTR